MKLAILLVTGLVGVTAISIVHAKSSDTNMAANDGAPRSTVQTSNVQLVDVRTPEEFAESRLEGAKNIELNRLTNVSEIELKKDQPVQVYCRSGNRSAQATRILQEAGYDVEDLGSLQSAAQSTSRTIL